MLDTRCLMPDQMAMKSLSRGVCVPNTATERRGYNAIIPVPRLRLSTISNQLCAVASSVVAAGVSPAFSRFTLNRPSPSIHTMIKRRPPRLDFVYPDYPIYFVTFCTRNRRRIPSLHCAKAAVDRYGNDALQKFDIALSRYVVMPDHVHLFVSGHIEFILSPWVGGLKRAMSVARDARQLWQPGFFDRVLRNDESYDQKWEYVLENPDRAGLVRNAKDWPFQGEIVPIDRA